MPGLSNRKLLDFYECSASVFWSVFGNMCTCLCRPVERRKFAGSRRYPWSAGLIVIATLFFLKKFFAVFLEDFLLPAGRSGSFLLCLVLPSRSGCAFVWVGIAFV